MPAPNLVSPSKGAPSPCSALRASRNSPVPIAAMARWWRCSQTYQPRSWFSGDQRFGRAPGKSLRCLMASRIAATITSQYFVACPRGILRLPF